MHQHPIEVILTRQWASYLDYSIWVMSDEGNLIYYNEPAEKLLGLRYDISGEVVAKDLQKIFKITDEEGVPIPAECLPINVALRELRPIHRRFKIYSLDGNWRLIESTAFPLIGQGRRHLGAVSIFWEIKDS